MHIPRDWGVQLQSAQSPYILSGWLYSMEMSRVHFIFGLYWAGQIVYSRAAPLPRIKVIYTNCLCLYACTAREEISLCFFSPPWNSLSNTVAERRAKGLSMDALTPPTIAHNGCLLHCLHHHRHIEIWAHHVFRFTNMGAERKTCLGLPDRW